MKASFLAVVMVFTGVAVWAQGTPDGETPANEGVCDDLMWATPGLYGLCVAFCEAQDCEPDFAVADPFENCNPSNEKLLEIYDRKKQPGDRDMPCVQDPCPCWSADEINSIPYDPLSNAWCDRGLYTQLRAEDPRAHLTSVGFGSSMNTCAYVDLSLLFTLRNMVVSQEELEICLSQVLTRCEELGL